MFLRFVLGTRDSRSGAPAGIISAAYELLRSGSLADYEVENLKQSLDWLESHLPVPSKFSRKQNDSHKNHHGVSWIRSDSLPVISTLRGIQAILENHGVSVNVQRAERPGYIVYEDEYQVVAEPFHGAGD